MSDTTPATSAATTPEARTVRSSEAPSIFAAIMAVLGRRLRRDRSVRRLRSDPMTSLAPPPLIKEVPDRVPDEGRKSVGADPVLIRTVAGKPHAQRSVVVSMLGIRRPVGEHSRPVGMPAAEGDSQVPRPITRHLDVHLDRVPVAVLASMDC